MVKEILKIRIDNGLGDNNPTFKDIEFDDYSAKFPRMGFPDLTATLMWPTPLDDEWTHKEYVVLRGEKFYVTDTPDAEKTNDKIPYKHDIGFTSEFARVLGNTYFEDYVPADKHNTTYDKPCSNNSKFTLYGTIAEVCDRLNCSFIKAGIGDSILKTKTSLTTLDTPIGDGYCVMVDPYGADSVYDPTMSYEFSWEDKSHWEAITEIFNITEIPFERRRKCVIFGALPKVVDHKFEYGHDNELLSVKHKNAKAKVVNRITMVGSSENIPHYYPNETEYGHIYLQADDNNNAISANMFTIKNISQLLSKIQPDTNIILKRGESTDSSGLIDADDIFEWGVDDGQMMSQQIGNVISWVPSVTYRHSELKLNITIKVNKAGTYSIKRIWGRAWYQNETQPAGGIDYISSKAIGIERFARASSNELLTKQVVIDGTGINLGELYAGEYSLLFHVNIPIRKLEDGVTSAIRFWLQKVAFSAITPYGTDFYWASGDKTFGHTDEFGVTFNGTLSDDMIGDGFSWTASGRMPFQDHLVPPKYRNTLGAERFYNALNAPYSEAYALAHQDAYKDPDTNNPYTFPNPFIEGAPLEHIYKNEDIKPTIEGVTNASGQLMGVIADIAYDADDNDSLKSDSTDDNDKNDSLKYEHSFFYIKLNIFNGQYGFDLFSHASQTDPMTIQMRDGSCNGCKFKIQALEYEDPKGLKSYKNPVQTKGQNGDIVDGNYADKVKKDWQEWQQNTQTDSIWICVQKDAETFGVIMPNKSNDFKPKIGDKFNIINIDLPEAYIHAAEKRLEEEGMRYMLDNNEEKFTFDIQASRIFFAENPDVLAQLDEYSVIKVRYNGREYEQYVNQLSIDCKSNEALPNIGIDLTDTLAVGQSFVEQVAERASSLIANPYTLGGAAVGGGGMSFALAELRYLNKQREDRTPFKLSSDIGFEVGDFISGASGGIFYRDPETGQTYIEADKLKIRMKAIFEQLEIAKLSTIGGKFLITPGGGINISFVEELDDSYRCYFKAKDEDKGAECRFVVGDQVQCREFNIQSGISHNASNRYYWRLVTAVNNDESYVELSKTDCDDGAGMESDAPQAGDTIVHLGNRNDPKRQSAIILSTVDAFAPCVTLYNGIDHYSLDDKAVVEYGVDKTKNPPEPFFNCYGRFFFGPKDGKSYIKFNPADKELEFKGRLSVQSSVGDTTLEDYMKNATKGNSVLAQYSADAENWHAVFTEGDVWMRTSSDDGETWTPAIRIVGEKGDAGAYQKFQFAAGLEKVPPTMNWSNIPPTPKAGEYIWMRSGTIIPPATEPTSGWSNPIRLTGDKGSDGESVYMLDMSNEMAGVVCTADGAVIGDFPETEMTVYKGGSVDTGWSFYIPTGGNIQCSASINGNVLSIDSIDGDTASVTVYAQKQDAPLLSATMNIYKVKQGRDGSSYTDNIVLKSNTPITSTAWNIAVYDLESTPVEGRTYTFTLWGSLAFPKTCFAIYNSGGTVYLADLKKKSLNVYSATFKWTNTSEGTTVDGNKIYVWAQPNTATGTSRITKVKLEEGENLSPVWSPAASETIGESAVVYSIVLSDSNVTRNALGVLSTGSIVVEKYKTTGNAPMELTTEKSIKYQFIYEANTSNWFKYNTSTSSIEITIPTDNSLTAIVVELYDDNGTLDRERIPILNQVPAETVNLVRDSDVSISSGDYLVGTFRLSEDLVVGAKYTFTIWGTLPYGKGFRIYDTTGAIYMGALKELVQGVYSLDITIPTSMSSRVKDRFRVYSYPGTNSSASTISKIKVERGTNHVPYWTASPMDIDYLRLALQENTTIDGGLILASLLQLGYTPKGGAYKIMSGMNGIAERADSLAIWAGGKMLDPEVSASSDTPTFGVRHDGTAFAANNTVRFRENVVEIGDSVRLDKNGLSMITNGSTSLKVANTEVDDSTIASNKLENLANKTFGSGGTMLYVDVNENYYVVANGSGTQMSTQTFPQGTIIKASGTVSWQIPYINGERLQNVASTIYMDIMVGDNIERTFVYGMTASGDTMSCQFDIGVVRTTHGGRIKFRIRTPYTAQSSWDEVDGNPYDSIMATISSGTILYNYGYQTTLGNNGVLAVWGNSTLLCNEEMVMMRHGSYGLRITDSGIQKLLNGTWVSANI